MLVLVDILLCGTLPNDCGRGILMGRPQYAVFPGDEGGYNVGDQYYIGDSGLLFKPVVVEGATSTDVYLADDQVSCLHTYRRDQADKSAILRLLLPYNVPTLQNPSVCIYRHSPLVFPTLATRWSYYPYPSTSTTIIPSYVARSIHIDHFTK
jgi:hypothetical protein